MGIQEKNFLLFNSIFFSIKLFIPLFDIIDL